MKLGLVLSLTRAPSGPLVGPELITNGTFDVDASWTKGTGWTISGGKANGDGTGTFTDLSQTIGTTLIAGATYRISLDVVRTSGTGSISLGGHNAAPAIDLNTSGSKTTDFVLSSVINNKIVIEMNPWVGTIDNVSVKKIG
jgi:hypothetical protein